jgi:hypothetical protein
MDEQTMKDYIEDLLQERADLYNRMNLAQELAKQFQFEMIAWRDAAIGTYFDGEAKEYCQLSFGEAEELLIKLVHEYV